MACAVGQAEDDLSTYLQEWLEMDTFDATRALSRLADDPSIFSAFWEGRGPQLKQVKLWIASSEATNKIRDAEERLGESHDPSN